MAMSYPRNQIKENSYGLESKRPNQHNSYYILYNLSNDVLIVLISSNWKLG